MNYFQEKNNKKDQRRYWHTLLKVKYAQPLETTAVLPRLSGLHAENLTFYLSLWEISISQGFSCLIPQTTRLPKMKKLVYEIPILLWPIIN